MYSTEILKQQLADELKLPLRDLRIVDPSFPNQIQATFIARPNVILFSLESIKVVVKHNEALVFNPLLPEVREFVPALQQQIQQAYRDGSIGGGSRQAADAPTSMRFEHVVIEAALNVVCNNLFQRLRALSPAIKSALAGLRAESRGLDIIQTQVDELLPLKNKLDELRKRVKEIDRAVKDLLDNDEDMALMYLLPPTPGTTTSRDPMGVTTSRDPMGTTTSRDPMGTTTPRDPMGVSPSPSVSDRVADGAEAASPYYTSSSMGNDGSDEEEVEEEPAADEIPSSSPTMTTTHQQYHHQHQQHHHHQQYHQHHQEQRSSTMSLEMMLENYLNEVGWIASEVDEVLDTIINTEENVVLQLDLLRNRILKFELSMSISSFIVTSGALVTGLFGKPVATYYSITSPLLLLSSLSSCQHPITPPPHHHHPPPAHPPPPHHHHPPPHYHHSHPPPAHHYHHPHHDVSRCTNNNQTTNINRHEPEEPPGEPPLPVLGTHRGPRFLYADW